MKTTVIILSLVAFTNAIPPRFKQFARQSAPPAASETPPPAPPAPTPNDAPYPPSGWKPAGAQFSLPSYGPPPAEYGQPVNSYGAPIAPPLGEYGPADTTTEVTTEAETVPPEAGNVQSFVNKGRAGKSQRLRQPQRPTLLVSRKQDLILLDDDVQQGRLSRVQILSQDNVGGAILRPAYIQIYQ